jgi:hypothetical protein
MADEKLDPKSAKEVEKAVQGAEKAIKSFSQEATEVSDNLGSIANEMRKIASSSTNFGSELKGASTLTKGISTDAAKLARFTKDNLKNQGETAAFLKQQRIVKGKIQAIDSKIAVLAAKAANARPKEREAINKVVENLSSAAAEAQILLKSFEEIEEINTELNDKTSFFDGLASVAKDIPVIGKLFSDFEEGAKAARDAGVEGGSAFTAGMGGMLSGLGKAALAFTGGLAIKGLFDANQRITDISRNLNVTRGEATALNQRMNSLGKSIAGLTGKDVLQSQMDLSENLGIVADVSNAALGNIATLNKKLGISGAETAKLAAAAAASGQEIADLNNSIMGTVIVQNSVTGSAIRYQDVLRDVAATSNATLLTTSKFEGGIAKAAFASRRLGLTLSQVAGISSNLLDFETSIANEMEAEIMLGRNLELDKARQAAATGNQAELAAELNRLTREGVDFNEMNVFQQQAFAKSLGMSREELADSITQQEVLNNLGMDGTNDSIAAKYEEIQAMAEGEDKAKAMAELMRVTGAEDIIRQQKNSSLQEKQLELLGEMSESMGEFGDALQPITEFFGKLLNLINAAGANFVGFAVKVTSKMKALGKFIMGAFEPLVKLPKNAVNMFSKLGKFIGGGFIKTAAKGGIKSLLKKIPILGAIVGIGMAAKRFKDGDSFFAVAAEGLSGLVSIFPGLGTGVSMGIDAALLAYDVKKGGGGGGESSASGGSAVLDDFTIRANPKDTITMAGGTKLGGNVEALLEELIGEVKKGGNVFLDGTSVGDALVLNSRLTN